MTEWQTQTSPTPRIHLINKQLNQEWFSVFVVLTCVIRLRYCSYKLTDLPQKRNKKCSDWHAMCTIGGK